MGLYHSSDDQELFVQKSQRPNTWVHVIFLLKSMFLSSKRRTFLKGSSNYFGVYVILDNRLEPSG